jgi:hypothetical protein
VSGFHSDSTASVGWTGDNIKCGGATTAVTPPSDLVPVRGVSGSSGDNGV